MQPNAKLDNFDRNSFFKTAQRLPLRHVPTKKQAEWLRACSFAVLVPIFVILIIVVTICSSFAPRERVIFRANEAAKCNIRLVESMPDGLKYPDNVPRFMSTYNAWNTLLDLANQSLYIGSFYWTMRGVDVINHTTAEQGEAIFKRLQNNGVDKKLDLRIAQSIPKENEPDLDTILLVQNGAARVRSVDFPRLVGGGVLHSKLWIADKQHFYLGSANMDWRSLTQVKELGVLAQNCKSLATDVLKIFEQYWFLGVDTATIPNDWPWEYSTEYNLKSPMIVEFNQQFTMSAYFSSSPPPLSAAGRTHDLDAILNTIHTAQKFVYVAVMDYFPLIIYTEKIQYWPYIDDALRKAAIENKVNVKLLISWWKHSSPTEDNFLRSLLSLSSSFNDVDIEVKRFVVPADADQENIPFGRVNHNKYMVTDNTAYIGTSNWSGDYFTDTAGIGLVLSEKNARADRNYDSKDDFSSPNIRDDLSDLFLRDWKSPYAVPFK